jgi:hypothetical protein
LNTTTNYFVINVSGDTFQVSTSEGGAASLFTTNITNGTLVNAHNTQPLVAISENTTDTNSALVLTPKGTGAFILGQKPDGTLTGGNARGTNAVDLQLVRGANSHIASGANSFAVGTSNAASGSGSIALGNSNTASGQFTIATGSQNTASGQNSTAIGGRGNLANATASIVAGGSDTTSGFGSTASATSSGVFAGRQALADRYAMHSHSAGQFAAQGDAQRTRFVLRCKTTTNSAVEMALDGSTTYLGIPSGKVIACTINISGVKSDGSAVSHYIRQYAVKNVGGTSSQVYAPVTIGTDNAASTSVALSVNNTDDTLRIAVTGIAAETWRWVAAVDAVEIGYGT